MEIHSPQIDLITSALAKAQAEIENPSKESKNPHYKSNYADLANVLEVCREPLSKNGLSITQPLFLDGDRMILATILSHSSGQWIKSFIPLPIQKPGSQEIGSCITYMRRYSLASLVGIFQDDDDAEAAQQPYRNEEENKKYEPKPATSNQKKYANDLISKVKELDKDYLETLKSTLKINSLSEISDSDQINLAIKLLNRKLEELKGIINESSRVA